MDILNGAKEIYRDEHRMTSFNNEETWQVLCTHKKWESPDPVDLTGDVPSQTNEGLFGHDEQPRPISKKGASKK